MLKKDIKIERNKLTNLALISLAPKGLIEFVPKEDPTVKLMMSLKGDIFPDYTEENFKRILS